MFLFSLARTVDAAVLPAIKNRQKKYIYETLEQRKLLSKSRIFVTFHCFSDCISQILTWTTTAAIVAADKK